ncbi:MAG: methyltransferase domain-containing protein, partial [Alphaproteobacteria bacterium]
MYSIASYGKMLADRVRVDAYAAALEAVVRPGCVVLELGTGPGFFALLAARLGAGKIYAIEPDDVILTARAVAEHNGLAERIELIQARSSEVDLPEPADVMVSDLRGVLPLFDDHLPSIAYARERHLKPDGILIPQRDDLRAAIVEAPDLYRRKVVAG